MRNKNLIKYSTKLTTVVLAASMVASMVTACGKVQVTPAVSTEAATENETEVVKDAANMSSEELLAEEMNNAVMSHSATDGKDETVYIVADATGKANDVIDSVHLMNGNGAKKLKDQTDLKDFENVNGYETYTTDANGNVTWDANGNDIYYQGTTDKQLPVDVKISYQLDGKDIAPEDLAGKSGKVTIRFDYTNNETTTVEINGKEEEVNIPFAMMSGVVLPAEHFQNIEVTNGRIVTEGRNSIVMGVAFPGLRESINMSQLKDKATSEDAKDKLDDMEKDIPDYVEITADAQDFELDMTMTTALSNLLSTINMTEDIDTTEIHDKMDELQDGSTQLVDGTKELKDGTAELKDGAGKLLNGTVDLKDGTTKLRDGSVDLKDGTGKLADGTDDLAKGVGDLKDGSTKLANGTDDLKNGTQQLADGAGALADGADQLDDGAGRLKDGAKQVNEGAHNLHNGIKTLVSSLDQFNKLPEQMQTLYSSIKSIKDSVAAVHTAMDGEFSRTIKLLNDVAEDSNEHTKHLNALTSYIADPEKKQTVMANPITVDDMDNMIAAAQEGIDLANQVLATANTAAATADAAYEKARDNYAAVLKAGGDAEAASHAAAKAEAEFSAKKKELEAARDKKDDKDKNVLVKRLTRVINKNTVTTNVIEKTEIRDAEDNLLDTEEKKVDEEVETTEKVVSETTSTETMPEEEAAKIPDDETVEVDEDSAGEEGEESSEATGEVEAGDTEAKLTSESVSLFNWMNQEWKKEDHGSMRAAIMFAVTNDDAAADATKAADKASDSAQNALKVADEMLEAAANARAEAYDAVEVAKDSVAAAETTKSSLEAAKGALVKAGSYDNLNAVRPDVAGQLPKSEWDTVIRESDKVTQEVNGVAKQVLLVQGIADGALDMVEGGLSMVLVQLKPGAEAAASGVDQLGAGVMKLEDGANKLANGTNDLANGASDLKDGTSSLKNSAPTLINGINQLNAGAGNLQSGAHQLDDGVLKLKNGAIDLQNGAHELDQGAFDLLDGVIQLDDGATDLNDGTQKLYDGVVTLDDGAAELADGMFKLDDEGISKLTELFGDDVDDVVQRINAVIDAGKEYNSFAGSAAKEGDSRVKFIYKTDGIKVDA